jgi:GT2 family glycosyltransferase
MSQRVTPSDGRPTKVIDVSVVIANHNSADFLVRCVDSVKAGAGSLTVETIVVDNASHPASLVGLEARLSDVELIRNTHNRGFSAANNQGVRIARGRYVLFLNPDTLIEESTLPSLVAYMDSMSNVGAATCFVRLPDGKLDDAAHRGFPTPWNALCQFSGLSRLFPRSRLLSGYTLGWQDLSVTHDIDALAGCFMLVRREAGEAAEWWDEDYFFYGEDLDFCFNLKQQGWKIAFVPEVSILHYKGMSSGIKKASRHISQADRSTRAMATRARFAAMRIFYDKHYKAIYPAPIRWLVLAGIGLKQTIAFLQIRLGS